MSYLIPSDTHAAGDTGHISDHNNIADVLTALGNGFLSLYGAPSGATAETFPRRLIGSASGAMTSGTLYLTAIALHQNTVVNNLTMGVKGTPAAAVTHGWYVLLDSGLVVRAVTADQTSGSPWGTNNSLYTFATNAYTATYSGLYYVGAMAAATTMPTLAAASGTGTVPAGVVSAAPVLCGTSSTGQTTPPAAGTAMAALTGAAGYDFYAYTS